MEHFLFHAPSFVTTGRGSMQQAGIRAARYGKKALIISDPVMEQLGYTEQLKQILSASEVDSELYAKVNAEPTDRHVQEALLLCQEYDPDMIVSLGGGSSLDTGKAVAMMRTNPGEIADYMGYDKVKHPLLPFLAIPTTGGTGSEASKVTVIMNTKDDVKMMLSDANLMPMEAIVDPELTLSMPKSVTAATGVDALTHAIEAFISKKAQPLTDTLALSAILQIGKYLRRSYNDSTDIEAREQVMYGALKAGMAFSNASVCLVHGMSRPIGAIFHVPHGVSNAMLLPVVMEYTAIGSERFATIAEYLGQNISGLAKEEAADRAVSAVRKLCLDLQIPNMASWGVEKEKLDRYVEKMAEDALLSGSPALNPRIPDKKEIIKLYNKAFEYDFES